MTVGIKYVINLDSIMLTSEYDSFANENTRLLEGDRPLLIDQRPINIINDSLLYYGSDLKGALKGAKSILGNCYMSPIAINTTQNIIWFPCKAFNHPYCIWLAYHNIVDTVKIDAFSSMVITKHGHIVELDMKISSLKKQMLKAGHLAMKYRERNSGNFTYELNRKKGFYISKEKGENYCKFRKKKI